MNKKYYTKKGASYKERLRCPLCGKMSEIGYFSQDHQFAVYQYCYAGKGKISVVLKKKSPDFMYALRQSIVNRLLDLLYKMTGLRYVPDTHVYVNIIPKIIPRVVFPAKVIVD